MTELKIEIDLKNKIKNFNNKNEVEFIAINLFKAELKKQKLEDKIKNYIMQKYEIDEQQQTITFYFKR